MLAQACVVRGLPYCSCSIPIPSEYPLITEIFHYFKFCFENDNSDLCARIVSLDRPLKQFVLTLIDLTFKYNP